MNMDTNWIWTPEWRFSDGEEPAFVYFRKEVDIDFTILSAIIDMSADSRYKLYINNVLVNCGPRRGDAKVWYYDTIDIAEYLVQGKNVLAVEVLRYPLSHRKGNHGIWRTETPGLYVKGNIVGSNIITGSNKENICLSADATWKTRKNTSVKIISENPWFAPLQILEEACGNEGLAGWKDSNYKEDNWENALPYHEMAISKAVSPGNLLPRPIPLLYLEPKKFVGIQCIREGSCNAENWNKMLKGENALTISANKRVVVELSAGELTTGYLRLFMEGGADTTINILTSECYAYEPDPDKERAMPRKGDRTDHVNGRLYGFTDTYQVSGYGEAEKPEVYEPYWFRTFRYIQLEISTVEQPIVFHGFDYLETGYPLEVKTQLTASDHELNTIWDLSLRTLKRCMHETYEDCPFYEQLQYSMDTRAQILYTYSVSADDRLARQCIDDFHRSQRYDGLINCSYPCYGPNVIPGFSIYYILMIYDHMMYFADKELVQRYMSTVEGILDFFRRSLDERGLVGKVGGHIQERYWSFIDWTAEWNGNVGVPNATTQGPISMESFLYVYGLQHAAELMDFIGRREDGEIYRNRAREVQNGLQKYCRGKNGLYQDGPGVEEYSQHCQVFAVLTKAAVEEEARRILLEVLPEDSPYAKCSVAMAFYMFRAMEEAGLYEQTGDLWNPWRKMIENNLTTSVEDTVSSRSDCHAWGAVALYELPAVILGVRPRKPGFEGFELTPVKSPFGEIKGKVVTPGGMIELG